MIPIQDYLGMNNKSRINQPSTIGTNWRWRLTEENLSEALQEEILKTTKIYGRMNWN
ncbi:MAG: 4-alpha-glucanotransferase [Dorea sp.]